MKLRNVEIVGFKSFRDRVSVDLSDGMTCIVGPNGCGKSNVVDAIKWAMGDMSPKSLRGNAMSDLIFAGTEKRRPAGMAEVTLTFENTSYTEGGGQTDLENLESEDEDVDSGTEGRLDADLIDEEPSEQWDLGDSIPREFQNLAEIAITRRLHRSGESEYLINKVSCRLMDIQNLLAGTGVGKQGYSIIEQGQIGFIVNARPSERRLIIEEASGITRYKDRRKRSERKLTRTEQNLQRTRDILDEIEKRMKSLERQAKKAREHRRLSQELEGLEIALLLAKRGEAAANVRRLKSKLSTASEDVEEKRDKLKKVEEHLRNARVEAHQADERHSDLTENFYKVETRLNLSRSNREHAEEAKENAAVRRTEVIEERTRQKERRAHTVEELARERKELEAVKDQPDDGGEVIKGLEAKLKKLKGRRSESVAHRDALRRKVEENRGSVRRIEDRIKWIDGQLKELAEGEESLQETIEDVGAEDNELGRRISRLIMDGEKVADEIENRRRQVEKAEQALEKAKTTVIDAAHREEKLARRMLKRQARVESLEEMRRRGEGYADGVRRVLAWAEEEGRDDILGPAGDFLHVPAGEEAAYAAFLGGRLSDIVVRDRTAALDALALLAGEDAGRVGCICLPDSIDEPSQALKSWLAGLEIVDDLNDVPALSYGDDDGPRAWATTAGDVIFSDGRVVGGGTGEQAETLLRQARELDDLRAELAEIVEEHTEISECLDLYREEEEFAATELKNVNNALQEATHRARGLEQELQAEERERERIKTRAQRLSAEREKLDTNRTRLSGEQGELARRCEELVESMPEREDRLAEAQGDVQAISERLEEVGAELTEHKVRVAQVDERRRHLETNVKRFEKAISHAEKQIERFRKEIDEQKHRGDEARMRVEVLTKEIDKLDKNHKQLKGEVDDAKGVLKEVSERSKSLELSVLGHRQAVDEAQEAVQKLQLARSEAQLAVEHATEQIHERFELELAEAQRKIMEIETPVEERKERAEILKRRLRRLGEVNALAIDEFEETKERHEFHAEQQADLLEAVADLRSAIERMDLESRKRFAETFEAVNEKFRSVFPRLFQGGTAQLILTEPNDLLETGVDIEVQPPGKKSQNVSLLSGGEKALTAVSLIFSIFLLKPTPFAVLDEVDAPLDEANVGRFADMVGQLSRTSQMIVITHNRRTMESPERLYGVTMEEPGVSKVVSVEMSEIDDRLAS